MFIMPSGRLEALWLTLCQLAEVPAHASSESGESRAVTLANGVGLAAMSWRSLSRSALRRALRIANATASLKPLMIDRLARITSI